RAEDGIRDATVTGVQTCALPIYERDDLVAAGHRQRAAGHEAVLDIDDDQGIAGAWLDLSALGQHSGRAGEHEARTDRSQEVASRSEERRVGKEGGARCAGTGKTQ